MFIIYPLSIDYKVVQEANDREEILLFRDLKTAVSINNKFLKTQNPTNEQKEALRTVLEQVRTLKRMFGNQDVSWSKQQRS